MAFVWLTRLNEARRYRSHRLGAFEAVEDCALDEAVSNSIVPEPGTHHAFCGSKAWPEQFANWMRPGCQNDRAEQKVQRLFPRALLGNRANRRVELSSEFFDPEVPFGLRFENQPPPFTVAVEKPESGPQWNVGTVGGDDQLATCIEVVVVHDRCLSHASTP